MSRNTKLSAKFINNQELPLYFTAADVVFIQRCQILNSGNIPMAFLFGKTVIGPKIGNVGEIIDETGNISFDPFNPLSIVDSMKRSIEKVYSGQGTKNKKTAIKDLSTQKIAKQIKQIYSSILNI
ncbi:hypothetical protein SDC9_113859 [bioreactor metagenome]|uniref:Glycosyl transferase family 1 domain-containing protein n=1 Tax=bioreactor metagenome TaxID=1076179 RepID=A0A645BNV7_9ZZZZ